MADAEISLFDLTRIFRRHKGKMALTFAAVMLLAVLVTVLAPRRYVSEGQLFVRLGRENIGLDPTATLGESNTISISPSREDELNTVATILKSRRMAEKVVQAVGYAAILNRTGVESEPVTAGILNVANFQGSSSSSTSIGDREKAIRHLKTNLRVEPVAKSNIVRISYRSPDPRLSQQVVDRLIDAYLDEHVRLHRTPGAHRFLMEQTANMRAELEAAEAELRDLKNKTGLSAPKEQRKVLVERMAKIQDELLGAQAALAQATLELNDPRAPKEAVAMTVTSDTIANSPAVQGMRVQLYALQIKAQELLSSRTEEHFEVQHVREQIASAKAILAEETLRALQVRESALQIELAQATAELRQLNDNALRLERLQRAIDIQNANYRKYAADAEQARIDHSLELAKISNISVVQPATLDPYPVFPKTTLNLVVGFILAVICCGGVAMIADARGRFDGSRSAGEKAHRNEIPVALNAGPVPRL
jgi:uncharacterized protein involved in exopolysaccharide biosynthesis